MSGPPAPSGTVLLPGADVLLLAVALPRVAPALRARAAAFAVEERIARPLDEVHVHVIGPAPEPGSWLVAVIGRAALSAHAARHPAPLRLVPEPLALPLPPPGCVTVWAAQDRAILRLPDGTGMTVPRAMLPVVYRLAGSPACVAAGGLLPDGLPVAQVPLPQVPSLHGIDLRQAGRSPGLPARTGRLALLVGAIAAAHLAMAGAGVAVLSGRADRAGAELRAALAAGGRAAEGDLDAALARALAAPAVVPEDGFLALLARVSAVIAATPGAPVLREAAYAPDPGRLSLRVAADDIGTLQALQAGLSAAGLDLRTEGSESGAAGAEMRLSVRAGAP
jgi:general secretion pathway protein L